VKRALALAGLAFVALVVQTGVARVVPVPWCPDIGLLVVVGFGLALRRAATGLLLSALVGYLSDLLSGSLLGQHMLLRMVGFGAARIGSRRFNLRGPVPLAIFSAGLSAANGLATWALAAFFAPGQAPPLPPAAEFAVQAALAALLAPFVVAGVAKLCQALGDEEGARLMRLEPRKFPA